MSQAPSQTQEATRGLSPRVLGLLLAAVAGFSACTTLPASSLPSALAWAGLRLPTRECMRTACVRMLMRLNVAR